MLPVSMIKFNPTLSQSSSQSSSKPKFRICSSPKADSFSFGSRNTAAEDIAKKINTVVTGFYKDGKTPHYVEESLNGVIFKEKELFPDGSPREVEEYRKGKQYIRKFFLNGHLYTKLIFGKVYSKETKFFSDGKTPEHITYYSRKDWRPLKEKLFYKDGKTPYCLMEYDARHYPKETEYFRENGSLKSVTSHIKGKKDITTYFRQDGKTAKAILNHDARGDMKEITFLQKDAKTPSWVASDFKDGKFNKIEVFNNKGEKLPEINQKLEYRLNKFTSEFLNSMNSTPPSLRYKSIWSTF